ISLSQRISKTMCWIIGLIIIVILFFVSPELGVLIVGMSLIGLAVSFLDVIWDITKEVIEYFWLMFKLQRMQNFMETVESIF
ncbi:hypothetical protein ACW7EJ_20525, partial [Acinetobacter soli]